ncbi:MAG: thymidylate synthase [candidate division KSB1 bacterium]|nr:thymidylate synthase [candidate division KSB1 bacterium]MDZ7336258.1 thymidylate synthase [candidate division KSB1 bacterium]MDZ7357278.1 thymidylate synthase [candidate division KSB1 bacterium]MDZ7377165.1 thymidylate synthase [candidate division KSB1 bacterium]MDZ7401444.1 thymidylate synthase [candidate division KSB1 bacterium]
MERSLLQQVLKEREQKIKLITPASKGNIPVVAVSGASLAEAWENAMIGLYAYGCEIRTQYDAKDKHGNYLDPPSKDCTMLISIEQPTTEPMIHLGGIPGGFEDLEEYVQEVRDGIKDHWIRDPLNPKDTRWQYTYHGRLFNYEVPLSEYDRFLCSLPEEQKRTFYEHETAHFLLDHNYVRVIEKDIQGKKQSFVRINQIEYVIEKLMAQPFTRQAQAITWQPYMDTDIYDPACLQSMWFRILNDEVGQPTLNMNVRFRSRDAYDASFMNCFAFIHIMEYVANEVGKRIGQSIRIGRYVDESDSFHIYGKRLADFENRFLRNLIERDFSQRTFFRRDAEPFFEERRKKLHEQLA